VGDEVSLERCHALVVGEEIGPAELGLEGIGVSPGLQLQLHSADNLAKNIEYTFGILRVESPASKVDARIWTAANGASQYRSPEWTDGLATFAPVQAVRHSCVCREREMQPSILITRWRF
jgi:hypothetical protein